MEQPFFLTDEELIEITDRTQWSAQKKILKANHIKFTTSATGKPRVAREHFLYGTTRPRKPPETPNTGWETSVKIK